MDTIKIFIGTSLLGQGDEIAEKTLEYSLRKHSSSPLECIFMRNDSNPENPFSGFDCASWATPFSGLRWSIPEICNFEGRAIYMDVDQLNLHDITELWTTDLGEKCIGQVAGRSCVMIMDCEKLKGKLPSLVSIKADCRKHYQIYGTVRNGKLVKNIDARWNILDGNNIKGKKDMWHLHFTNMSSQPWKPKWAKVRHKSHQNPWVVKLWESYRDEMLANEN